MESFRSWLSYKENPVLARVAAALGRQRERLERRYGKRRADRIVAVALLTGLVPVPGAQVAAVLAMLGISEAMRLVRGSRPEDEREASAVAASVGGDDVSPASWS